MKHLVALLLLIALTSCGLLSRPADNFLADTNQTDTTVNDGTDRGQGQLLSAFFGLDNGLPFSTNIGICPGGGKADGMPIIFDHEVDSRTLQAGDFRVVTQLGKVAKITCVTMFPAIDTGELRTALLVGDFGSANNDPPNEVKIVGNLLSLDQTINFKATQINVTPLLLGPTLILAEIVPQEQWQLGKESGTGRGSGSGCPQNTIQIVRAVWTGGVEKANSEELGDAERLLYQIALEQSDGSTQRVAPFALADLGDGDNNHLLCLAVTGTPRMVSFPAGHLVDPNHDLNPATSITVSAPALP
ncbi:hypothetical protein JOY44_26595 (plasmid) [Phormidium sp. CLA17]|uniref:hypothetical protein n=1 Tax=Leptolyngbya sp. Cla-17 TaxID=2803751 RepID=UPI0014924D78|nr:hypothetical protein [Leptolyngbya sp. Cla-17]MBM0745089.1 hypothetical protein [Leptolyngbya sp. Cla-17]